MWTPSGRFDLGEVAIRKMLELHPNEACYYALMCNLYASDGRWSQVNQVRELMKQRGLRKSHGCSQVEMDISEEKLQICIICKSMNSLRQKVHWRKLDFDLSILYKILYISLVCKSSSKCVESLIKFSCLYHSSENAILKVTAAYMHCKTHQSC